MICGFLAAVRVLCWRMALNKFAPMFSKYTGRMHRKVHDDVFPSVCGSIPLPGFVLVTCVQLSRRLKFTGFANKPSFTE